MAPFILPLPLTARLRHTLPMAAARRYTTDETLFLQKHWGTMKVGDIALRLSRGQGSVSNKARELGLTRLRKHARTAYVQPTVPHHCSKGISLVHIPTMDRGPDDPPPSHYLEMVDG